MLLKWSVIAFLPLGPRTCAQLLEPDCRKPELRGFLGKQLSNLHCARNGAVAWKMNTFYTMRARSFTSVHQGHSTDVPVTPNPLNVEGFVLMPCCWMFSNFARGIWWRGRSSRTGRATCLLHSHSYKEQMKSMVLHSIKDVISQTFLTAATLA